MTTSHFKTSSQAQSLCRIEGGQSSKLGTRFERVGSERSKEIGLLLLWLPPLIRLDIEPDGRF